jgi:hypothetical protein
MGDASDEATSTDRGRGRRHMEVRVRVLSTILAGRPDRRAFAGQGLAEYALILTLIAIVAILALLFLGSDIQRLLSMVGSSV